MAAGAPFLRTRRGIAITVGAVLVVLGGGLSGLAALHRDKSGYSNAHKSNDTGAPITEDAFFYGQSPAVYPSPTITGAGTWADSYAKAAALVYNMTLDERVSLTSGVGTAANGCSGFVPAVPRVGFPGLCLSDAGNGLRNTDFASSWPSGIHAGASWNRLLTRQRGHGMGAEFRKKGVNVMLGPVVGPAGRTVRDGRYWEGFSVDPYLAGAMAYQTVTGVQSAGVITSTKHFIANEQETNRQPHNGVSSVSANIDDRTMHEFYLWPFQDAVYAGSGNIMCSYNRVNNSYACGNSKTLNGLLKSELGFQGFVVSDWGAQHSGVATALAGMDMTMPDDGSYWGSRLVDAVQNGSVPGWRVADMATRIVAAWYQMGQDKDDFPEPGVGMPADLTQPHRIVDARNTSAKSILLRGAVEGHVLLKNENNTLPLKAPRFLSLFGYSAKAPDQNNFYTGNLAAWSFSTESANGSDTVLGFAGNAASQPLGIAPNGTLFSGGGSGGTSQSLVSAPYDALVQQAWTDDTELFWDFTSATPTVNAVSDACLVFVNAWASEGFDRPGLRDNYTDNLITHVADQCSNTIVIVHNAGARIVDAWIDHPNVKALVFAHLPGQSSGRALVSLLYGQSNPSGKLPYTVAKSESDYGDLLDPAEPQGQFEHFPQANFAEGVFLDYRRFDAKNITPRFEFGFGLSYTTFNVSHLQISKTSLGNGSINAQNITASKNTTGSSLFARYPTGAVLQGGQADLWDELVTVTVDVNNTGKVAGAEVAQLYVTLPGAGGGVDGSTSKDSGLVPLRQLRGFEKPYLEPSQATTVGFALTRRDLSIWDTMAQKWLLQEGTYTVAVGSSSRNLPLRGTFVIP